MKLLELHFDGQLSAINPEHIVVLRKNEEDDGCTIFIDSSIPGKLSDVITPDESYYSVRESLALLP